MNKLIPALVALVLAASCGGSGDAPGPASDVGASGVWKLESGRAPTGEVPLLNAHPITLQIDGRSASGTAACNSYGGGIQIEGDSFTAGELVVTEIECPPDVAESEERYLEAIAAVDAVAVDGDTMTLTGDGTELVFRRAPPVETEALVDTTWMLDGLVTGEGPDAAVSSARPARLRLDSDGTFEGSTGCRDFSGDWTVVGDRVVFSTMTFAGSCREAALPQDDHVITVLAAGFRAEVEGRRLTLTSSRGKHGLVYVAK